MIDHPLLGGKLTLCQTFVYYDQPVLYSAKNAAGKLFLVVGSAVDYMVEDWMLVELDLLRYQWLLECRIDLYTAFRGNDTIYHAVNAFYHSDLATVACEALTQDKVSDSQLPDRGEFLTA